MAIGEAHGLLPDPYVVLGQAAAATTTIKVGTAVAVPLRAPMLAAGAMATLQALSGGRAAFSLGRGDGADEGAEAQPSAGGASSTRTCTTCRRTCTGRRSTSTGSRPSMSRIDDFDPSLALPPPPLNIAATGPKTIEVAARWADGVSFSVGADLERLRSSIALAHEACERVGRDPATLALGCYVQVAVDEGGDRRAREAIRGLVVTHARFSGFEAKPIEGVESDDHERYRNAVETMDAVYRDTRGGVERPEGSRPGEFEFYPQTAGADELIDAFAIAGPAPYCAERLAEIAALGFGRVYIGTRAVGVDLDEENTERIGREVLALLR